MNPIKFILIPLTCLLGIHTMRAQDSGYRYEVSGAYHFGFILAHRNDIKAITKGYTRGGEITLSRRYNGQHDWEQKYAYPYSGVSLFILDFGNPKQLGQGYGLLAFYDFPLNRGKKLELSFKIGIGPGYVTKVYDRYDNFQNYGISTHVNGFAHGNFRLKYHFRNMQANLGVGICHFSNASYKKPNLGINIPVVNVGLAYDFHEETREPIKEKAAYKAYKKWYHDIILAYGSKEKNPIGGENHSIYTLHYDAGRQISFKSRIGMGADIFYNTSLFGETSSSGDSLTTPSQVVQGGMHLFYALQISKVTIYLQYGRYLFDRYDLDGDVYNRAGVRFQLNEHILLNLSMKTHLAIADYAEYGIGYRF